MTDTQERVVRDQSADGQTFGLGRKLKSFIASEWFIYSAISACVVVVAALFSIKSIEARFENLDYHHTIKSLEARIENLDYYHTIKSLEARIENLDHTIKSIEARIENLDYHHTIKSLEARIENLDYHPTIKSLEARFENLQADFDMLQRTLVPRNCAEVYKYGKTTSGVYMINPDNAGPSFAVFCDQKTAGGGWTVFQKRLDGSVDFDRSWSDYKNGFGNLSGEFWLGLDKIHRLRNSSRKLRVDLEDFDGRTDYAEYDIFAVADERKKYKLSVGNYSDSDSEATKRTSGDSLTQHHGYSFTTKDKDNDKDGGNCAQQYKGGWWYHSCYHSNLNGVYRHAKDSANTLGVSWKSWKRNYNSLKRVEMKIRPVEF